MNILHFYLLGVVLRVSSHRFVYNITHYTFKSSGNASYNISENLNGKQFFRDVNMSFLKSWIKDQNTNFSLNIELEINTENRTLNLHSKDYKTNINIEGTKFPNNPWSHLNLSSLPSMINESDYHTDHPQHKKSVELTEEKFETKLQEAANASNHIKEFLAEKNITINWLFI
ncbi:unnamed protein product [Schistosoma rodhaini]|uniref:Uncharacterized protein n=1 Tax=Schistosoma rodhaini TaxID=6188 RepID=A0AA85FNU5_9TREM|nr:unnamed protein product [Schistosoma rodhaini]